MSKRLQLFGWKKSNYDQPQKKHACGLRAKGVPCSSGPTSKGKCPIVGLCTPSKKGKQYQCSRSEVSGGPCTKELFDSPECLHQISRCHPVRSLLSKRRQLTIVAICVSLLFCIIFLGISNQTGALSPGELSSHHGHLSSDCASCHQSAQGNLLSWTTKVVSNDTAFSDSKRCLVCHNEFDHTPFSPHSMEQEKLEAITQKTRDKNPQLALKETEASHQMLACSSCHQEHNGKFFNIATLSDQQCQSCHAAQFESFSHGHPELKQYPYAERSKIYFDHSAHFNRYFSPSEFKRQMPNGVAPESCQDCHHPDSSNHLMETKTFDIMCASCHQTEINDVDFPGITFWALPKFQQNQQNDYEARVKEVFERWSLQATDSSVTTIPSFMELLLISDASYQKASRELGEHAFGRLTQLQNEHPESVANYLNAIEKLLDDISQNGEQAIKTRLGEKFASLATMQPSILESIRTLDQNRKLFLTLKKSGHEFPLPNGRIPQTESSKGGGWYFRESDSSIRYRPTGHSDKLLKNWLEKGLLSKTIPGMKEKTPSDQIMEKFFDLLANPSASGNLDSQGPIASGQCLKCHSVDLSLQREQINWKPFSAKHQPDSLTQFSHQPHLLSSEAGKKEQCSTCHQLKSETEKPDSFYLKQYFTRSFESGAWKLETDPSQGVSCGFSPISKKNCAQCHTHQLAGESCLKCHSYHSHELKN